MKTIDNYLDYIVAQIKKLKETQANAIEPGCPADCG